MDIKNEIMINPNPIRNLFKIKPKRWLFKVDMQGVDYSLNALTNKLKYFKDGKFEVMSFSFLSLLVSCHTFTNDLRELSKIHLPIYHVVFINNASSKKQDLEDLDHEEFEIFIKNRGLDFDVILSTKFSDII